MKVFLSWSGKMSHQVASILHDWLPLVIQAIEPFISSQDISKGTLWSDELMQELSKTDYGIICITPYNINAPWLNFEAGALLKTVNRSRVSPFLFRVGSSAVRGPLSQFQSAIYEQKDFLDLLVSINGQLEKRLPEDKLRQEFEKWWDDLHTALDAIEDIPDHYEDDSHGYNWIYSPKELIKLERGNKVKSVWIITPDLFPHLLDREIRDVVRQNVARGITYRFIIPDSSYTNEVKDELRLISSDNDQIEVKSIPDEEFHNQAVTDYILINPPDNDYQPDDDYQRQVFLRLPVTTPGAWILVNDEASLGFTGRFCKMWNRQEVIKT